MSADTKVEPPILFVKPGALKQSDKRSLKAADIIVIEIDEPQAVKFIRAAAEIRSTELLDVALQAMAQESSTTGLCKYMFGKLLVERLIGKKP